MRDANFRCSHCHKQFVHEDRLLNHKCKQKERADEINSPIGQAAWFHYQSWMRAKHRLVPQIKAFLHSKFYGSFIRFAKFAREARIPDAEIYIALMVAMDMPPVLWTNDQVYVAFLEHMDKKVAPMKLAQMTINTLFDVSEDGGWDIEDVFENIDPNDLIQLTRQRKLSPWILLHSNKFKQFYVNRLSKEQRIVLETIIRPKYWGEKLKNEPKVAEEMKHFVNQLGLSILSDFRRIRWPQIQFSLSLTLRVFLSRQFSQAH